MHCDRLRRRQFITVLGGVAVWPLVAWAQQAAMPVIGYLHSGSLAPYAHLVAAFHQSLKETGYIEGRDIAIEYRWVRSASRIGGRPRGPPCGAHRGARW